jgi:hypothetical protein
MRSSLPREAYLDFVTTEPQSVDMVQSVVCWIDLLGLRDRLARAAKLGNESDFVAEYLRVLRPIYTSLQSGFSDTDFQWHAFTDSIVISVPHQAGDREFTIGHVCLSAAEIQFRLSRLGWFLRGGLAVGSLFADDNFVVGSGLMQAYKLEGEDAVNPRIILGKQLRDETAEHLAYYAEPWDSPQNGLLAVDEDQQWFISYLFAPIYLDFTEDEALPLYAEHRAQIVRALQEFVDVGRLRSKYLWSAAYFNWFCSTWVSAAATTDLIIPDVPPRGFSLLVEPP